jgi:pimeloyl-ACP methyl ester carboxylesterase
MDASAFTSRRRQLAADGGDIAYTEFGEGPAAVFVHGIGTSGLLWRHVIEGVSDTSRCIAIDLPLHGGTPAREDLSLTAMAGVVADLCAGLGLDQVDLVGNDSGGAVAQILAGRHPELLRSLVLTNCDTEDNLPPQEFAPLVEAAARGELTPMIVASVEDPSAWRTSPIAGGYEHPDRIPDEVWRAYLVPVGGTLERARHLERMLAALNSAELKAVSDQLRTLDVPTLLVWGTGYPPFGIEWAYRLREAIPGAREVIEIDGAKVFFPEERPEDLVPHLHRHWGR